MRDVVEAMMVETGLRAVEAGDQEVVVGMVGVAEVEADICMMEASEEETEEVVDTHLREAGDMKCHHHPRE